MMRYFVLLALISFTTLKAQVKVDLTGFSGKNGATAAVQGDVVSLSWPAGTGKKGRLMLDLSATQPVFKNIELQEGKSNHQIAAGLDPAFVLTVGKRDLISQNGWNIFFDKVPSKPFKAYNIGFVKQSASVRSVGARTVITIGLMKAADFNGSLEI